jgi:large subunit ribosomal protein L6
MSRVGKQPVKVPEKVTVTVSGLNVKVKGPKGELSYTFGNKVNIELKNGEVIVTPTEASKESNSLWGTARVLINNMVTGVTVGFTKSLEFNGVGYKAAVSGSTLTLNLGYSHPIEYKLPKGIEAKVGKNTIDFQGSDKELVGFVAATVRAYRPPEPYKGKGLKYIDEKIIRKAGKAGAKG